jgi:hypothetical protein
METFIKKSLISIALASSLLLTTGTGIAGTEGETYVGVQYAASSYNEDGISKEFNPSLGIARFGRFLAPNISIEGRVGFGPRDDTQFLAELGSGYDATLDLNRLFGVYATGHINLTESASIYGVAGASKVKGTTSVPAFSGLESTENNSSISYGIGADIGIGSNVALNVEYMRYLDKSSFDLDAIAVGALFSF